ncbi:gp53-like domain-containing protein [Thiohalomonas denitrificans]|uniref:gp53-like domain-containing protein n=1 Tax=Thiohalomonas denitrificans TaxID=415747 RepID=UPI0026F0AB05|nr:hypothetical protein [Thiohalomonas denitrificans]
MDPRNYLANASGTPPVKPASPSNGFPQSAVPGVNEATTPGPFWFYKIGEELRSIITAAGITPSDDDLGQLLAALSGLGLSQATDTFKGIIELATALEVQGGTDDQRAITPAGLASFDKSHTVPGHQVLPGGLILQWGSFSHNINSSQLTSTLVTFPIAFNATPFGIWTELFNTPLAGSGYYSGYNPYDAAGFTHICTHSDAAILSGAVTSFLALGI